MKHYNYIILILSAVLLSACMDYPIPVTDPNKDNHVYIVSYYTSAKVNFARRGLSIDNVVLEYSKDSAFADYQVTKMEVDTNYNEEYTDSLTNLDAGCTYYARFRVSNKYSYFVTEIHSFDTKAFALASVKTVSVDDVTTETAVLQGKLSHWGSDNPPTVGFYYATHFYVTEEDSCITVPVSLKRDSTVSYSYTLEKLQSNQIYYFRAFAKNEKGVSFGEELSFNTLSLTKPEVSISSIINISSSSATVNATVSYGGGMPVTERGICYSTSENPTMENNKIVCGADTGAYSGQIKNLLPYTTYYVRPYAINSLGTSYGEQIQIQTLIEGAMSGVFSVSATQKVRFSKGNLQFNAAQGTHVCADGSTQQGTWRFAENQSDTIGADNAHMASDYNGWIDIFGWGTSGYNDKYPYISCPKSEDETPYKEGDITGTNYDWGVYNAISNGGNIPNAWRTMTRDEWYYIFYYRDNARSNCGIVTIDNRRSGFVLLPDDFVLPEGLSFDKLKSQTSIGPINNYSKEEWGQMESAGAVFLPISGKRIGTEIQNTGVTGYYWTSIITTVYDTSQKNVTKTYRGPTAIEFFDGFWAYTDIYFNGSFSCYVGCAVRLVQDVK